MVNKVHRLRAHVSTINREKNNYTTSLPRKQELIVNRKQHKREKCAVSHRGREGVQRLTITCLCAQQVSFTQRERAILYPPLALYTVIDSYLSFTGEEGKFRGSYVLL